jgi:glutamate formiminotransferase
MPLIEAVPNFSEGRRPEVIAAIVQAIQAPGVLLLDVSSDHDHNRTVVTVAGEPAAVVEGAFRAVQVAAQQIDMFVQRGAHPRLGATDVLPLVPLEGVTLEECAALATTLGKRIGDELQIPVYLYEAAARRPERRNLADVRRGEFESLLTEIALPQRAPDFGPARLGSAGATIVGARTFLVAWNFFLATGDLRIAKSIATTIRERDGGLPGVKALGLLVDGQAQVSVNLVDFTKTPLHKLVEAVHRLADRHDTAVARCELIGLLPQEVMLQAAAAALGLPALAIGQTVEGRIREAGSL